MDRWVDLLHSYKSVYTTNYSRFTYSHTLHFTGAHTQVFSACYGFISLLVTASNGRHFSSFRFPGLSYQLPTAAAHNDCTATVLWLTDSPANCPAYNISALTAQKTPFLCCCLGNRHLHSVVCVVACFAVVPSNGSTCKNISQMPYQLQNIQFNQKIWWS
jgi:hypothetical protein